MIAVEETIEGYRIEALLVSDLLSAVYRARHVMRGTVHAVRYLKGTTPADRDRLLDIAQIQARLRHPNVVGIDDVLLVRGSAVVVSELVDGPSLEIWLSEGRVPVDIALALFRGIVTGMGAAHGVGLVHSDLRPANVRIARGPSGALLAKIGDFGLARKLGQRWRTENAHLVGPTPYLAPEQFADPEGTDPKSDLWALGCLLYELVCGARAFPGTSSREAIEAARYQDPATVAPQPPARVIAAIHDLLKVDRDLRIATCADIWSRLWGGVPAPPELESAVRVVTARSATPQPPSMSEITKPVPAAPEPVEIPEAVEVGLEEALDLVADQPESEPEPEIEAAVFTTPPTALMRGPPTLTPPMSLRRWLPVAAVVAGVPALLVITIGWWLVLGRLGRGLSVEPAAEVTAPAPLAVAVAEPPPPPRPAPPPRTAPLPRPAPPTPPAPPMAIPTPDRSIPRPPVPVPVLIPRTVPVPIPDPVVGRATGTVQLDGDATSVWLDAGGQRFAVDQPVPAGRYLVRAAWGDGNTRNAGAIQVHSGARTRVRCASFVYACTEIPADAP